MAGRIRCMIRLDDITPDMDWERFDRAKEIFQKYGIYPLIGVVPDNRDGTLHKQERDPQFWSRIRSLQERGWMVAQHGTYHVYETKDSGILGINPFSEFAGLSYEEQVRKLQEGKRIMEENGIVTDIFMAPGHTYDQNTLKALRECGFKVVTDGLYDKPYRDSGLLFIPCRLRGLKKTAGTDTICLHTNLMSDADMRELEAFCRDNREWIVPFETKQMEQDGKKRTWFVALYERCVLWKRNFKNKIAGSKRLAWYMQKTNHASSKVKWLKRLVCFPMLLLYRDEK